MKTIELNKGFTALIDDDDYELVSRYKWYVQKVCYCYYAIAHSKTVNGKRTTLRMHRLITGVNIGTQVDHINHDGLDNTRGNLRTCTQSENQQNKRSKNGTSKYKGVHLRNGSKKWRSSIRVSKKLIDLGCFTSETEAAIAYNTAAIKYFGEFACLNEFN